MNDLQIRLVKFSVDVSEQTDDFYEKPQLESAVKQLNRATSSVGANYSEAQSASSRKDFHNKLRIALKEAREAEYWLLVLYEKLHQEAIEQLAIEAESIIKILTTIAIKTDPNKSHP